jgi:hypothetical protein
MVRVALSASEVGAGGESNLVWQKAWLLRLYTQLERLSYAFAPEMTPFFSGGGVPHAFLAALTVQAGLWWFLTGGVLDRYARGRPIRTAAFFAACGVFFMRFLRLAVIAAVVGFALWKVQQAFAYSLSMRAAVLVAVVALGIIVDFAKVRTVIEDRHSMVGALSASLRFISRRIWRVLGLVAINALAVLAAARVELQIATTVPAPWVDVLLSAALLLALTVRLALIASEAVFFQGELAHAGYTAGPPFVWPDSPAVEALDNLRSASTMSREDIPLLSIICSGVPLRGTSRTACRCTGKP